jgi:hypothetical protein
MILPYLPPRELRNIKSIGQCVYCGSKENLSREHVVPRGMGGTITLPKGSCARCAKITHAFETECMRTTLLRERVKLGLHRHPKERPETFPITFTDISGVETVEQIEPQDYPTVWNMPIYEHPGILRNVQPEQTKLGHLHAHTDDPAFRRLLERPG